MSSILKGLLDEMRGVEKTAGEGPSDPPPMDQSQKVDSLSLGQEMMAKIQNFMQAASGAGAGAPPEAVGAEGQPAPGAEVVPAGVDPNAAAGAPAPGGEATVTLQVPANAIVKIASEITTKDEALAFLTSCGLLEGEK